jgi:predicted RNA-binding protein with PUA-like domain
MDAQASRLVHTLEEYLDADDPRDRLEQIRWVQAVVRDLLEREVGRAVRILVVRDRLHSSKVRLLLTHIRLGVTTTDTVPPEGQWYEAGIRGPQPL